jgi:tetratricopeptide (TPR) repeat protein
MRAARATARQEMRERLWTVEASGDERGLARLLAAAEREVPDDAEVRLKRAIGLLQRGGPADIETQAGRLVAAPLDDAGLEPVRALVAAAVALASGKGSAQEVERACQVLGAQAALPPRAALLAGRTLLAMGWIADAERLLARVGSRDPRLATIAAESLADCHHRTGRYAQALESCAAFATLYDTPARRYLMLRYADGARRPEQARLAAEELARRHPDSAFNDAALLLLGKEKPSDELLARARQRPDWAQAQPAIERLLITGYLAARQPERAIEVLERFLGETPRDPNLRTVLGTTLLRGNRRDEGLEQLRKAAEDGDRLPFERDMHWGVYHFFAGRHEQAIEHYRAAARLCPNDPMRLRPLAGALAAQARATRDPAARIACWRQVVEVQEQETRCAPEDARARHLLGEALGSLAGALEDAGDPEAAAVRARRDEMVRR